jgi:hypothetical protein
MFVTNNEKKIGRQYQKRIKNMRTSLVVQKKKNKKQK